MKTWIFLFSLLLLACTGSLTDEQRQKMREQMELHKIKRITDVEITEAAYAQGRKWMDEIESAKGDSAKLNSIVKESEGRLRWIVPGATNARAMEQQLMDAYVSSETGSQQDNVQKVRTTTGESDSLLYTKPIVTKLPDGTERLDGIWNVWFSRKEIILAMDKK